MDNLERLKDYLEDKNNIVLAFSGGTDSSFLAYILKDMGKNFIAVTVDNGMIPDIDEVKERAGKLDIPHGILELDLYKDRNFIENDEERCYFCKQRIIDKLEKFQEGKGYDYIADGSNKSDSRTYRAGMVVLYEAGVLSPLMEAGFTKDKIIKYSRKFGLEIEPPESCLATRVPSPTWIRRENIEKLRNFENAVKDMGFSLIRARLHEDNLRLQVLEDDMYKILNKKEKIYDLAREEGFGFVSLDLEPYPFEGH